MKTETTQQQAALMFGFGWFELSNNLVWFDLGNNQTELNDLVSYLPWT